MKEWGKQDEDSEDEPRSRGGESLERQRRRNMKTEDGKGVREIGPFLRTVERTMCRTCAVFAFRDEYDPSGRAR